MKLFKLAFIYQLAKKNLLQIKTWNMHTIQAGYPTLFISYIYMKRLEHIMNERLSKLDLLETMAKKLDTFELSISQMRIEIDDIKETQDKHIRIIDKQETHLQH
jgi:hypothetical protein